MKEAVGIIPARLKSTRMHEKLLQKLAGKSVLERTWQTASKSSKLEDLIIAADDERIVRHAEEFGAKSVLTSAQHICGTDRICEAVASIDTRLVVNIQADEPLIHPSVINALVDVMGEDKSLSMATAIKKITDPEQINDPNIVKVVIDRNGFALYFSRTKLPFSRDDDAEVDYYKHIGIYVYTKDFLYKFKNIPPSTLEQVEKLEQLRVLESGFKIKTVLTTFDSWGIDTEEDLEKVERIIKSKKG